MDRGEKQLVFQNTYKLYGAACKWWDAHTSSMGVAYWIDVLNAIDEPFTESSPFHSGERELLVQPAKCSLCVKWLAAMGKLY